MRCRFGDNHREKIQSLSLVSSWTNLHTLTLLSQVLARKQGVETVDNDYFVTEDNLGMLKLAKEANSILVSLTQSPPFIYSSSPMGCAGAAATDSPIQMNGLPTVGCVVVDSEERCAAGTSTGGLINKMMGRIGDSPLIGAGTYASELCGVSCTGEGEAIIRSTLARDVSAVMEYKGLNLQEAVDYVIKHRLDVTLMECATEDGFMEVAIWE